MLLALGAGAGGAIPFKLCPCKTTHTFHIVEIQWFSSVFLFSLNRVLQFWALSQGRPTAHWGEKKKNQSYLIIFCHLIDPNEWDKDFSCLFEPPVGE